ncbi:transmembrane protein 186 [Rhagoletis pomonella]|uniref:transmembrane protein 186 n=1 Tax=Rhagoletis pomonella TaxID=28610 RepID=UPI0017820EFA|nr:transmembrane protein 186 [Rhagoletis pomonella]
MSICCLIRKRVCVNLLYHPPSQVYLFNTYSICSRTSLLAQPAALKSNFGSVNYATAASTATGSKSNEWLTIYRLPLIRLAAGFQRLKIYQGGLTALALPITIGLSELGQVSPNSVAIVGVIGASGLLTLSLCSLVVRNVVGFMYINEERDKVKVAYVNYWGKRCEAVVDINDLDVDWTKVRPTVFNLYQKIRLYSNKNQSFKLLMNYGVVVEPEIFTEIFGE